MVRTIFPLLLIAATTLAMPTMAQDGAHLQIIVSKASQTLTVYDGDKVIATSRVSTGKEGHTTPSGIFSIIQKAKYHESNLYSNAPMPWMQRITWSGVALHQSGSVPNHPASHGCVRLPAEFARKLYGMTTLGAQVIITDAPVTPVAVSHPFLFTPKRPQDGPLLLSDAKLRAGSAPSTTKPVEVAMIELPAPEKLATPTPANTSPLRILITYRGPEQIVRDAQTLLQTLGFETGGVDGQTGPQTRDAIRGFKRWKSLDMKGALITPEFLKALYTSADTPEPPRGHLYVRQNFKPLFDAPVTIAEPDQPLGTYFLDVTAIHRQAGTATWQALTLDDAQHQRPQTSIITVGTQDGKASPATDTAGLSAVLDRISVADDVRARIESAMTIGTSLTITDHGIGQETGEGTDFITILPPKDPTKS
ncbi:peptidoglycan hydrolase-like protein with peptidoglycan-binding domain [Agrobacterium vitis]|nr:peptidoglycan hydrolase-like protein with peptidoglycan-binding domain [Agrobacterium vitis]